MKRTYVVKDNQTDKYYHLFYDYHGNTKIDKVKNWIYASHFIDYNTAKSVASVDFGIYKDFSIVEITIRDEDTIVLN